VEVCERYPEYNTSCTDPVQVLLQAPFHSAWIQRVEADQPISIDGHGLHFGLFANMPSLERYYEGRDVQDSLLENFLQGLFRFARRPREPEGALSSALSNPVNSSNGSSPLASPTGSTASQRRLFGDDDSCPQPAGKRPRPEAEVLDEEEEEYRAFMDEVERPPTPQQSPHEQETEQGHSGRTRSNSAESDIGRRPSDVFRGRDLAVERMRLRMGRPDEGGCERATVISVKEGGSILIGFDDMYWVGWSLEEFREVMKEGCLAGGGVGRGRGRALHRSSSNGCCSA